MKTIIKLFLIFATALSFSRSDLLDVEPTTFVSDEVIWKDKKLIDQFVANTYGSMLCGFNRNTAGPGQSWAAAWAGNFDSGTDDYASVADSPIYTIINKGAITAQNCPFVQELWTADYEVIRKCNIIISKIQDVDDVILSPTEKNRYEAEARFLRALCYFDLARTFGKAPLITYPQSLTDELKVAPSDFAAITQFIVDECDDYANNLELEMNGDLAGHATKGAFLALKARTLLYNASPLNNSSNEVSRWSAAAKAAKDVIDLNIYKIYKTGSNAYYDMQFDKTDANKEYIFSRRFSYPELPHNVHMMWSLDSKDAGSWNGLYPTQNLVDAYETTNGLLPNDPSNTLYDAQNPYVNRDKRFYQSIIYNGSTWEGNLMSMVTNTTDPSKNGLWKPVLGKARCGYGPKKFIEELPTTTNLYGGYAQNNFWPYFRYAEVLLNYAEAQNEALAAPDQSVYDAIDEVRERGGLPQLPAGLSKDQMRARIKNERRVEFTLEEHRFWDLRRWKDGNMLKEPIRGMNVYTADEVTYNYVVSKVEDRSFDEKHYYLPIPYDEQQKNPLLK